MADDLIAAALADMRERVAERDKLVERMKTGEIIVIGEFNASQDRLAKVAPQALAAVEAALKLAGDWQVSAAAFEVRTLELGDPRMGADNLAYARKLRSCSAALREAIGRELTGKENDGA